MIFAKKTTELLLLIIKNTTVLKVYNSDPKNTFIYLIEKCLL
jgi:hypothetical protein